MEKMHLVKFPCYQVFLGIRVWMFFPWWKKNGYSGIKGPVTPYLGCVQSLKNDAFTYSIQI